jgi:hypothetical protein
VNGCVTLQRQDTSRVRVVECVTLEVTVEDLDGGVWHRHNAWHLSVSLPGTPVQRQDAVVHFEDAALHHYDAVHFFFHVELTDAVLAAVLVELNGLLVRLHVQLLVRACQHHLQVVDRANFLRPYVDDETGLALLPNGHVEALLYGFQNNSRFSAKYRLFNSKFLTL